MVLMEVGIRKGVWGKQSRRKIPAVTVKSVGETQEASRAVGTLPFSVSLTSRLTCSNISSWQLVKDASEIFDYKQRWVISLVLGCVKSTLHYKAQMLSLSWQHPCSFCCAWRAALTTDAQQIFLWYLLPKDDDWKLCELPHTEFRNNTEFLNLLL